MPNQGAQATQPSDALARWFAALYKATLSSAGETSRKVRSLPILTGGLPWPCAVEPILQHLFERPEDGDCIEFMRIELGESFAWSLWLSELVRDLVQTGVLVISRPEPVYEGTEPAYFKLSVSTWLKLVLARAEQYDGEAAT